MVGISFTPEQIRAAPPEVRRWIERELIGSLGLQLGSANAAEPRHEHLVACSLEEVASVLSLIQGMFPVVNVFFELGRQGASLGSGGLEAFRLADILQHTRLPGMSQVIGCLDIINEALRRIRTDPTATLYVLDKRGECIVAALTQQNIARLWQQVIGRPDPSVPGFAQSSGERAEPPGMMADSPMASPPRSYGQGLEPDSGSGILREKESTESGI